jgi:predicted enzyme related to lactoylglutathione lyase
MASLVTHFEIHAEESATLANFYRNLFGWQIDQAPGLEAA